MPTTSARLGLSFKNGLTRSSTAERFGSAPSAKGVMRASPRTALRYCPQDMDMGSLSRWKRYRHELCFIRKNQLQSRFTAAEDTDNPLAALGVCSHAQFYPAPTDQNRLRCTG